MESWMIKTKEGTILVMDGHRIVVPLEARKSILTLLHVPHMATSRTRKAAYKSYFWVGMATTFPFFPIQEMVQHVIFENIYE